MVNLFSWWRDPVEAGDTGRNTVTNRSQERHLRTLEDKIDSLSVLTVALLELMEESGISQKRIEQKIEEVDLRDGRRDQKLTAATHCSSCDHRISKRHQNCFYCGAKINTVPHKYHGQ